MNREIGIILKEAFSKSHGRTKRKLNFMWRRYLSCDERVARFLNYNILLLSINILEGTYKTVTE